MSLSTYRIVGLESILYGPCNADYSMPAVGSLESIGHTVPETAKMAFATPEAAQFYTEESNDVDVEILGPATKGIEFATYDMGNDTFVLAFGGSESGTTIWKAPTSSVLSMERAVKITTKTYGGYYMEFEIPRLSLRAGGELKFSKAVPGSIAFQGTVLKAGTNEPMTRTIKSV